MTTSADLAFVLSALGKSADEVAACLHAQRVQGLRNTARFMNPICRYVEEAFSLGPLSVDLIKHDTLQVKLPEGTGVEVRLAAAIVQFMDAFNRGAYPEMEIPAARRIGE